MSVGRRPEHVEPAGRRAAHTAGASEDLGGNSRPVKNTGSDTPAVVTSGSDGRSRWPAATPQDAQRNGDLPDGQDQGETA